MISLLPLSLLLPLVAASSTMMIPLYCHDIEQEPSDYLVFHNGRIYRQSLAGETLPEPLLMADLSASGWKFSSKHKTVLSWLPRTLFGYQQHFEQLMVLARDPNSQLDQLVIVRLFPQQDSVWQFDDLKPHLDETAVVGAAVSVLPISTESLWQQMQQAAGWWRPLPGWGVQLPQLYAGMLYMPTTPSIQPASCPQYPLDLTVTIIHMHSGHATKPEVVLSLQQPAPIHWQLKINPEQQISLWLDQGGEQWQLDAAIQQITAECLDCYQTLDLSQWPQQIELATFWYEEGAY